MDAQKSVITIEILDVCILSYKILIRIRIRY